MIEIELVQTILQRNSHPPSPKKDAPLPRDTHKDSTPRIRDELLRLNVVSQVTVGTHLPRRPKRPLPAQRSAQPADRHSSVDMFFVATATFRVLYSLIGLDHERQKIHSFWRA